MPLDPSTIFARWSLTRPSGTDRRDWLLAVTPEGTPWVSERDYVADAKRAYVSAALEGASDPGAAAIRAISEWTRGTGRGPSPEDAAMRRWRAKWLWFVASDRDGQSLLRALPFQWPASPMSEGLFQARLTPDGMPDLIPEPDPRYPDARVDPERCLVTKTDDPFTVARWWWALNYGGFPREVQVAMYRVVDGERQVLPRTEAV